MKQRQNSPCARDWIPCTNCIWHLLLLYTTHAQNALFVQIDFEIKFTIVKSVFGTQLVVDVRFRSLEPRRGIPPLNAIRSTPWRVSLLRTRAWGPSWHGPAVLANRVNNWLWVGARGQSGVMWADAGVGQWMERSRPSVTAGDHIVVCPETGCLELPSGHLTRFLLSSLLFLVTYACLSRELP